MESSLGSKSFQYVFVFVATGLVAVLVKVLGDYSSARLAGMVSTLPVKIVAAWLILGGPLGSEGIRQSTTGMFVGIFAIGCMLASVRVTPAAVQPPFLVAIGISVWCLAIVILALLLGRGSYP